jgi:N-dimethylarginine dimethylaminohydrolase
MLPGGDGLFLGHGMRSERAAAGWLEHHVGIPVWPLELRDPHLYHLDMALSILPDGTALVCPWALTRGALSTLARVSRGHAVIPVRRESALAFGLNLVAIGDTIVLGAGEPHVEALLRALGYRCVVVPLAQFHRAGGSGACLVASVHHEPGAAS